MQYISKYNSSSFGEILLAADDERLIGLWFYNAKYYCDNLDKNHIEKETEIIKNAKIWLDIYFQGKNPDFTPPLNIEGSDFRKKVWNILRKIPYGKTVCYGDIAKQIAKEKGIKKISAQAVGNAIGHNPISIIIPCHRVIGSNGKLTGYAGGTDKKAKLLELEGFCDFIE